MADIFISYSQKDRAIVAPLAAFLEGHGYDVWWDTALRGGAQIRQEIGRQLASAKQVVVVWSANAAASDWVLDESDEAQRLKKLLPTRVADFAPQDIPHGFRQLETKVVTDRAALLAALAAKGATPSKTAAGVGGEVAQADGVAGRRWIWWSTYESIAAEVPSVWAIIETVLAVAAYWCAAIWLETYAFLLAGVAIAPLVLLRSDASVAHGLRWFQRFEATPIKEVSWRNLPAGRRALVVGIVVVAAATSFALCWWLSGRYLTGLAGWHAFFGGAAIGWLGPVVAAAAAVSETIDVAVVAAVAGAGAVAVAVVVAAAPASAGAAVAAGTQAAVAVAMGEAVSWKRLANALTVVIVPTYVVALGLGFAAALLVVSLVIRTAASLLHLPEGLLAMPRNFRRLVLSTSPLQAPELVPGLVTTDSHFRLDSWIAARNKGDWADRIGGHIVLLAYIPVWAYRISIKSTAWFWWPLAYVGREAHEARDPEHMRRLVLGSPFRRLGRWIAALFLVAFAVVNGWDYLMPAAKTNGIALPELPENSLIVGLLLNRPTGIPWQLAGVASALIALFVGMWTGHAAISLQRANELKDLEALVRAGRPFPWIERVQRLSFLCTLIFWLGLAGHLAVSVNSQRCWVKPPPAVTGLVQTIYGDLAPHAPRCNRSLAARDSVVPTLHTLSSAEQPAE